MRRSRGGLELSLTLLKGSRNGRRYSSVFFVVIFNLDVLSWSCTDRLRMAVALFVQQGLFYVCSFGEKIELPLLCWSSSAANLIPYLLLFKMKDNRFY